MRKLLSLLFIAALGAGGVAFAQTYPPPQVTAIGASDLFQDVVGGTGQAESYYATAGQMGVYGQTLPGGNYDNALIGGDFATNLFQRGTSVSTASTTYYVAYGADRWFTWGGTSTPTTMTQQTGAGDFPTGTAASYRINKGSLTGTKQICTSQIVQSANAYRFQGHTAEFAFDAKAGAGFSAASSNLAVYVSTGTGADEGSTYMAYGLNALGGAGTTAWAGQVNLGGSGGFLIPITTTWARYGVAVPIPAAATEIGVSICYTPVGTGTATDWFEFAKAQLSENAALTSVAGASGAILLPNDVRMKAFARRTATQEAALQYGYYYQINESGTTGTLQTQAGPGTYTTTTLCSIAFPFPAPMWKAPSYTNALTGSTFKIAPGAVATPVVTGTPYSALATGEIYTTSSVLNFTTTAETVWNSCALESVAGGGVIAFNAEE